MKNKTDKNMNYQYYAQSKTKEYGIILTPYSRVFENRKEARSWKRGYDVDNNLETRKLIIAEAIEELEINNLNYNYEKLD